MSDLAKEHDLEVSTHKIDTKFRPKLLEFLRSAKAAQSAQVLAAHFKRTPQVVEHYLDMLSDGKLAQYVHVGRGEWGWIAARIEHN